MLGSILLAISVFVFSIFVLVIYVYGNAIAFGMLKDSINALYLSIKNIRAKDPKEKVLIYIDINQRDPDDWGDFTAALMFTFLWLIMLLLINLTAIYIVIMIISKAIC